jgi:hypothetical protein
MMDDKYLRPRGAPRGRPCEDTPRLQNHGENRAADAVTPPVRRWQYRNILDQKYEGGQLFYLVEWNPTWERSDSLNGHPSTPIGKEGFQRSLSIDDQEMVEKALKKQSESTVPPEPNCVG